MLTHYPDLQKMWCLQKVEFCKLITDCQLQVSSLSPDETKSEKVHSKQNFEFTSKISIVLFVFKYCKIIHAKTLLQLSTIEKNK